MHAFSHSIHLLYVPTLCCNLDCAYCYLGEQTSKANLEIDSERAASTLRYALQKLRDSGVLAFNLSLHGGEVTTLPVTVLEELFALIRDHYRFNFDAIHALGHKKSAPHIKTNLYTFAPLYELFNRYRVSISASIDLPLALQEQYRISRGGKKWLAGAHENLQLLARYPHAKKISATLCREHVQNIPAIIDDIWFIHNELGYDMNQFNIMFAFDSAFNRAHNKETALHPKPSAASSPAALWMAASPEQQLALYNGLKAAFVGTDLEDGLRRNWFDEFTPSYCTNAYNCGQRFFLLQSDGNVYSCVRGQGIEQFYYGNIYSDSVQDILSNGARKIEQAHRLYGFDANCQSCNYLSQCHTGCPVVKFQNNSRRSYTCEIQRAIYKDYPQSYPPATLEQQRKDAQWYIRSMHPQLALADNDIFQPDGILLPSELIEEKNTLRAIIASDPILQILYSEDAFLLELNGEMIRLTSQILKEQATWHTLVPKDCIRVHMRRSIFDAACPEFLRNSLFLQMLRNTKVVYGDEKREKQEHILTYQLYANCLKKSELMGAEWLMADLSALIELNRPHYRNGVRNNLFFTTFFLREYHYQKQKNNAFYHIQAINLPFQNFEFHYLLGAEEIL